MFRRLRIKLTIFCTVITGLILAVMSVTSLMLTQRALSERGNATFVGNVNSIMYHLASQQVLDHTWLAQTETNDRLMIYLEDSGAPLLFAGSWSRGQRDTVLPLAKYLAKSKYNFDIETRPKNQMQTSQIHYTLTDTAGERYYASAAVVPLQKGWIGLIVVKSMSDEHAELAVLRTRYLVIALLVVVLLAVFAWFFTGKLMRPIEESRKRQMEFVSAASHELRSPLAVIETSTTAILQAEPDRALRFRNTVLQECHRMSRLIGDMLLLAGADNRTWSIHKAPAEPETLLLNAAESFESSAAQKSIRISTSLPTAPLPRCSCDAERIAQVLSILLDNAISYTPEGGRIVLSAQAQRGQIQLRVADNGAGIPDEHKESIFHRFYRLDAARTQKEHYGLGLSIAREIATLHKGSLWVEDAAGGGSVFILSLPTE